MVGRRHNINEDHETVIASWIENSISGAIDRYDDLHIDRIDAMWKLKGTWVSGGLKALAVAAKIRAEKSIGLTLALSFSLRSSTKPLGINFETLDQLAAELNHSPPSLYLFREGHEPWFIWGFPESPPVVIRRVKDNVFGQVKIAKFSLYSEFWLSNATEYARSVFLVA
jgi:hypothetical protein